MSRHVLSEYMQSTPLFSGHRWDRDLVFVIARVRNSGVRENVYFKPYLQKGVTCVLIFIYSSTFFRPVVA